MQLIKSSLVGRQPACHRDKGHVAMGTHGIKSRGGPGPGKIPVHVLHQPGQFRCHGPGFAGHRFNRRLPGIDRFGERRIRIKDGIDRELSLLQTLPQCNGIPRDIGFKVGNGLEGGHQP